MSWPFKFFLEEGSKKNISESVTDRVWEKKGKGFLLTFDSTNYQYKHTLNISILQPTEVQN